MFHFSKRELCLPASAGNRRAAAGVMSLMLGAVMLCASGGAYASGPSGPAAGDQLYAALLADEDALLEHFPDGSMQDGKELRFGTADLTGDGTVDLIVSMDETGSSHNSDTCFYTVNDGSLSYLGLIRTEPLQRVGYNAEHGYVYLYTEKEDGEQTVALFSFSEDSYESGDEERNCLPFMTFAISPDKEENPHYYADEEELSEKQFQRAFIEQLGKPVPFYEDAYYYGWDGYAEAAGYENTPEERLRIFGTDGSRAEWVETETEAAAVETETEAEAVETETEAAEVVETEALAVETETAEVVETEAVAVETEAAEAVETEAAEVVETEAVAVETEAPEDSRTWICPVCGYEALGNFCSKCGAPNPSPEWICPKCLETATGNFCSNCGSPRPSGEDAQDADAPETETPETEAQSGMQETEPAPGSWETNLLMEEHGAVGELKANGNMAPAKDYVFDNPAWIRSEVLGIYILDTKKDMPPNAIDVSAEKNGSVMAWMDGYNNLYIAGEGGVRVNENAGALFAWYENVREIRLNGNLHTDYCTNMSHMFYHCNNLTDLDLVGMNTANVTNMTKFFTDCSSIRRIDVSGFSTANVRSFYAAFQKCRSLEELYLTDWDTGSAQNMALMFADCNSLTKIITNTMSFRTDYVETMSYMFDGCECLYYVNLANINTGSLKRVNYMFRDCKVLDGVYLDSHDLSGVEEHKGMFQGAYLEHYYGTNGEVLFS